MNIDRAVLAAAGSFILASTALGFYVSPYWLLFSAFVGLNLLQSSMTGFCPLAVMLRKMGMQPGAAF